MRGTLLQHLEQLWQRRELVATMVMRDLKVRYKNSVLGVIWSWLNPFLMMLIFTFVFGVLWPRSDQPHYHIFLLSGLLPWQFFSAAVLGGLHSIAGNGHLIKKVYFPREILPISVVLSALVNFVIALPVFFALALISGAPLNREVLLLPIPILVETLFAIGVVLVLSTLEVFYRDTHMVMDVAMQAWFFLTPIFYPIETLPAQAHLLGVTFNPRLWLFRLNPMASIINTYQDLLYRGNFTALDFLARTALTALVILVAGYWFFQRFSGRFGEEL